MRILRVLFLTALCSASLGCSKSANAQNDVRSAGDRSTPSTAQSTSIDAELQKLLQAGRPLTPVERRTVELIREAVQAADTQQTPSNAASPAAERSEDPDPETAIDIAASPANENARDPCLLSWDPKCYQKHAADYDPWWGYAPSVLRRQRVDVSAASNSLSEEPDAH